MRYDKAFNLLLRDIENYISHFKKKYRISIDLPEINNRFIEAVPEKFINSISEIIMN